MAHEAGLHQIDPQTRHQYEYSMANLDSFLMRSKIKDLLLNKIENLNWSYFKLDLNDPTLSDNVYVSVDQIVAFFDKIEATPTGRFKYVGQENPRPAEVLEILFTLIKLRPQLLPRIVNSLFKSNEIANESGANEGRLGRLNEKDQERRDKVFKEKIRDGFRQDPDNIVILAEGDSWFQFPKVYIKDPVEDIIDWIMEDERYAVKSLAAGGEWLSNIFYSGEYVEELPKLSPDVFLISGGGNDMVGNNRLALFIRNLKLGEAGSPDDEALMEALVAKRKDDKGIDLRQYERGLQFVSPDFIKFLNVYFVQYFVFLYNLSQHPRYQKMLILTQGYDYVVPFNKSRANWLTFRRLVNNFLDTGKWLFEPLALKGILDKEDQEAVLYVMIYEFNEMLIQLAEFKGMKNVFHIDCRGLAKEDDWFDELHLKSNVYEKIAEVFKKCIEENLRMEGTGNRKVYKVTDIFPPRIK